VPHKFGVVSWLHLSIFRCTSTVANGLTAPVGMGSWKSADTLDATFRMVDLGPLLNELGSQGWELAGVRQIEMGYEDCLKRRR
jgi:hypothetical protein